MGQSVVGRGFFSVLIHDAVKLLEDDEISTKELAVIKMFFFVINLFLLYNMKHSWEVIEVEAPSEYDQSSSDTWSSVAASTLSAR